MEAIITIVGFLGAGKTTLLKFLTNNYIDKGWNPFIVLNDYENAHLDAQQLTNKLDLNSIKALSGSCICCSGIMELRDAVNRIPKRKNGITLIEANGTSDACSLIEFLGVGLNERYLPPIQISVVDVKNWQQRDEHNELESNQVQVSSLIVLTHLEMVSKDRIYIVREEIKAINSFARIMTLEELDVILLPELQPSTNTIKKLEHEKAHWSSCSTDLPEIPDEEAIYTICNALPKRILRVKGCTKIKGEKNYVYFERNPDGEIFIRPFNGIPVTGSKLLTIGPGSTPHILENAIELSLGLNKIANT